MTCTPAAQKQLSDCRRAQLTTLQVVCIEVSCEQSFQGILVDQCYGQRKDTYSVFASKFPVGTRRLTCVQPKAEEDPSKG